MYSQSEAVREIHNPDSLQLTQHIASLQARLLPEVLVNCLQGLTDQLQQSSELSSSPRSQRQQQHEQACNHEPASLHIHCCLAILKKCTQTSTCSGILQEVAGLLQDQLQRHPCLVQSLLGRHAACLLDNAPSLDILLRIVPLLQPAQQAEVYNSFAACLALLVPSGDETASPGSPDAKRALAAHCMRQLDRLLPAQQQPNTVNKVTAQHLESKVTAEHTVFRLTAQLAPLLRLALLLGEDGVETDAGSNVVPASSPSVSCGTATSAAASSAGSAGKAWSSGSNLAASKTLPALKPSTYVHNRQNQAQTAVGYESSMITEQKDSNHTAGVGPQPEFVHASIDSVSGSSSNGATGVVHVAQAAVQQAGHARVRVCHQQEQRARPRATAAVGKAGTALQTLLDPSSLLPLLGLQSLQSCGHQQGQPQARFSPASDQQKKQILPDALQSPQWRGTADPDVPSGSPDSSQSKAQRDVLVMLGLAPKLKQAADTHAQPALDKEPHRTQQQAEHALDLVEVLIDSILCHTENMLGALQGTTQQVPSLENSATARGAQKPSGREPSARSPKQAAEVGLQLLSLHAALGKLLASKAGSSKVWRPKYLTLHGAHGLLDLATQLLTEASSGKPQRRRSGVTARESSASTSSQMGLMPDLATYLLCLVGYVLEDSCAEEADSFAAAAEANAVYKLIRQEHAFNSMAPINCPAADAVLHAVQRKNPSPPAAPTATGTASFQKMALAGTDKSCRPPKRAAPAVPAEGRAGPSSPGKTKRHRAGPSRLDQTTWPVDEEEGMAAAEPQLAVSQAGHPHSLPQAQLSQPQQEPKQAIPRSVPCNLNPGITGAVATAEVNMTKSARRIVPQALTHSLLAVTARSNSNLGRDPGHSMQSSQGLSRARKADMERSQSIQEASSFSVAASGTVADSSHADSAGSAMTDEVASQDGHEARQGEEEEDSEDVSGKVLTEFGSRGDLWWEDFIAAKEEMLTDVLQDDPSTFVELPPAATAANSGSTSQALKSPTAAAAASASASSVGRSKRQPNAGFPSAARAWRPLTHAEIAKKHQHQSAVCQSVSFVTACLSNIAQTTAPLDDGSSRAGDATVPMGQPPGGLGMAGSEGATARDSVLPVLGVLSNPQELKLHVMTACQLIDRGVGSRIAIAANQGAVKYRLGACTIMVLGHLVGCFARDFSPAVPLQEAYLHLLSTLCSLAQHEHDMLKPGKSCTPPLRLLSDSLQAFVARIPLLALKPTSLQQLLQMVLRPLAVTDSLQIAAATLWAVAQGCAVGEGGVTWAEWAQCLQEPWAHAWMYKLSSRQRKGAVLHLLSHCSTHLSALLAPASNPPSTSAAPADHDQQPVNMSLPSSAATADQQVAAAVVCPEAEVVMPEAGVSVSEAVDRRLEPVVEAAAGQAVAEATLSVTLAVLQGVSEDSESHVLYSTDVLGSLLQLALLILHVCSSAQRSLQTCVSQQPQHTPLAAAGVPPQGPPSASHIHSQPHAALTKTAPPSNHQADVIDLTAEDCNQTTDEAPELSKFAGGSLHGIVSRTNALLLSLSSGDALHEQSPSHATSSEQGKLPDQASLSAHGQLPNQAGSSGVEQSPGQSLQQGTDQNSSSCHAYLAAVKLLNREQLSQATTLRHQCNLEQSQADSVASQSCSEATHAVRPDQAISSAQLDVHQTSSQQGVDAQLPEQAPSAARLADVPKQAFSQASAPHQSTKHRQAVGLDDYDVDNLCMLCAYGMDLAAALGCLLQQVEDWSGDCLGKTEMLQQAVATFKSSNSQLLSSLVPQTDAATPAHQAALHDALGNAIEQYCQIVGTQDSDACSDSMSESGSGSDSESDSAESAGDPSLADTQSGQGVTGKKQTKQREQQKQRQQPGKGGKQPGSKGSHLINPFILAAMAESRQATAVGMTEADGDGGDFSDLEDFIVCKPDRSYRNLFAKHYRYSALG